MSDLRETYGHPMHRPLVDAIAGYGGLIGHEAGIADDSQRIDPLELVRQRACRDFAAKLLGDMGWTIEFKPPATQAEPRQTEADSDGVHRGG
jgi:hypothetical protein